MAGRRPRRQGEPMRTLTIVTCALLLVSIPGVASAAVAPDVAAACMWTEESKALVRSASGGYLLLEDGSCVPQGNCPSGGTFPRCL